MAAGRSDAYWARRAEGRRLGLLRDAERAADEISRAYLEACRQLQDEADKIFRTFQRNGWLSEAAARRLLNQYPDANARELIKRALASLPEGAEKQAALAQVNAPAYQYRIGRLEQLRRTIGEQLGVVAQRELEISTQSYVSTLKNGYYRHLYDVQRGAGLGFQVADFSPQRLREALAQEWSGRHYSARIWDNAQALAERLRADLVAAALSGRSEREIARQIAHDYQAGAYASRRLVRTESAYLAGRADQLAYEELGIDRYRYLATLDMRTSSLCQGLDGRQFDRAEAKVGVNYPPMHPNCRSTTVAVIDDEALEGMERRAKNPVTGETELVPAHMSYDKWLQGLEEKYGVDSLAVSRKKVLNARQDRAQLKEYRRVLGNRVPRSLDAFQTLKYTDNNQWQLRKLDYSRRMDLQEHPEKALPMADRATAAEEKFTKYLYNPERPDGYAKGKGFEQALGFDEAHWPELREQLIENARLYPAQSRPPTDRGTPWQQDQILFGINGRVANVIAAWFEEDGGMHLVTAHLEEVKKLGHPGP